jgi:hypothetical protein
MGNALHDLKAQLILGVETVGQAVDLLDVENRVMKGIASSLGSPVSAFVSVRTILSAYTTSDPCSPLRTWALNSCACLKVIQMGAA